MTLSDKLFIAFLKSFIVSCFGIERREIAKKIKKNNKTFCIWRKIFSCHNTNKTTSCKINLKS